MKSKGNNMKTNRQSKAISRRGFLKTLGGAALSGAMYKLTLLGGNLLWTRPVFAAEAPQRVIFVYIAGGAIPDEWMPSGTETDFTLPSMSAPLESVKQHCVFLNGVNMSSAGHGLTSKALGSDKTMTLDIYMARTLGQVSPFSQLQLGVISNGYGSISRYNWNEPAYEDSPFNAFDRLFGAGAATTEDLATRQKRSVLDSNLEALNQMRSRLGSFEKARLDEHTAAVERIDARLTAASEADSDGACTSPIFNSSGFSGDTDSDVNFDAIADLQVDVATLALKCDLTRVVSLMFGNHQSDYTVPEAGVDTNYHQSIHGRPMADYIAYRVYFTEKLRYLIESLAGTEDMDGNTLLDNTLVLQVSDMGDGRSHAGDNVPYMLAGGGGGVLTTGRSLTLDSVSHNTILDTVAQAAGVDVSSADYEQYGDGPISGIFN
ncbi:MAG: DUF1552 domain-containing protein [Desulfobacteraceae bacterium]